MAHFRFAIVACVGLIASATPVARGQSVEIRARELLQLGKFDEARALFQGELRDTPLQALTGIGDSFALAGKYSEARDAYQRLLQASATSADRVNACLRLAESWTYPGNYAEAERALEPALALARAESNPDREWTVLSRLNALHRFANQLDEADRSAAAMATTATNAALSETAQRDRHLTVMEVLPMIAAKRGNEPLAMQRVEEYFRAREAAGQSPKREMMLGLIAAYLGHYATAVADLESAPQRDTNIYLTYWIGVAHESLGHAAEARAAYTRIVEWRRTDSLSRLSLPLVFEPARARLLKLR
ncbi:MAG TPA: tetratricopeptide repeat protein [Vicinamibacterales bacterium]|nr:tetratricopeptide repeat protein [Vicinamibacterales bacterium]